MLNSLQAIRAEFEALKAAGTPITSAIVKDMKNRMYLTSLDETGVVFRDRNGNPPPVMDWDIYGNLSNELDFESFEEMASLEQELMLAIPKMDIKKADMSHTIPVHISTIFEVIKTFLSKTLGFNKEPLKKDEVSVFNGWYEHATKKIQNDTTLTEDEKKAKLADFHKQINDFVPNKKTKVDEVILKSPNSEILTNLILSRLFYSPIDCNAAYNKKSQFIKPSYYLLGPDGVTKTWYEAKGEYGDEVPQNSSFKEIYDQINFVDERVVISSGGGFSPPKLISDLNQLKQHSDLRNKREIIKAQQIALGNAASVIINETKSPEGFERAHFAIFGESMELENPGTTDKSLIDKDENLQDSEILFTKSLTEAIEEFKKESPVIHGYEKIKSRIESGQLDDPEMEMTKKTAQEYVERCEWYERNAKIQVLAKAEEIAEKHKNDWFFKKWRMKKEIKEIYESEIDRMKKPMNQFKGLLDKNIMLKQVELTQQAWSLVEETQQRYLADPAHNLQMPSEEQLQSITEAREIHSLPHQVKLLRQMVAEEQLQQNQPQPLVLEQQQQQLTL